MWEKAPASGVRVGVECREEIVFPFSSKNNIYNNAIVTNRMYDYTSIYNN